MRFHLLALPFALAAAPALAQAAPAPSPSDDLRIPRELSDPALANRLVDTMQALSKAFLNLPVGEAEAALQGRPATAGDKRRTVATESGMSERELKQKIDESRPMMIASQRALMAALPAMMKGLKDAEKEFDRAAANMPRPDYPKR
ncbi:hypothetical protein LZ016_09650 [Sphingomonas sp. SM33]|uniref:LTXXQ motif family protein n=1 Tax=Sphingomonas telluris TaxID=2907998 RepID=A0ABS9VN12_9SPHN|nr:hypothetical protein [Sphingomonas telluris]MCH8616361.1 hypothetical protein [Sphingomonas telluris]